MNHFKKPGQVDHVEGRFVAIAAIDFAQCSRILTGEILVHSSDGKSVTKRIVVIGGKVDTQTVIVGRHSDGEDLHVPLLSSIYVDFESAADAYATRSEDVYAYATQADKRNETLRRNTLRAAALKLLNKSIRLRSKALGEVHA